MPSAEFLANWAAAPAGIAELDIQGNRIAAARSIVVDLGGIAKGEIVDRLLELFVRAGIHDALVDAGGDVRVIGSRGGRAWTIGVQSPRAAEDLLGSIELRDGEAAFTSGDYERYFDSDSGRSHHLLDPRTGRPATHTQAVTVLAANGALADAAATAIFVAGPENWRATASALGITHVLRVGADGAIEMTPAMRERVRMHAPREPATMPGLP
jgi:thiamine biosynthesis lipoprotein